MQLVQRQYIILFYKNVTCSQVQVYHCSSQCKKKIIVWSNELYTPDKHGNGVCQHKAKVHETKQCLPIGSIWSKICNIIKVCVVPPHFDYSYILSCHEWCRVAQEWYYMITTYWRDAIQVWRESLHFQHQMYSFHSWSFHLKSCYLHWHSVDTGLPECTACSGSGKPVSTPLT